jgi:cytosine/adenosine deaminase-related metal-dependent hydrolase
MISLHGFHRIGTADFEFENAIAFPGLINSHDHLEFNVFPRLGSRVYGNYVEWSEDIQVENRKVIDAVLKIPKALRTQWGLYKNLLNGVTTVVHHGDRVDLADPAIAVFQQDNVLHSVRYEKSWRLKLNSPFKPGRPFVMHIGEGTDSSSRGEIDTVIRWNVLRREVIAVHGVAMTEEQASSFKALVWCPDSNYFLFDRTADVSRLRHRTKVLFGTDSTLTASWNLWEQLRLARKLGMLSDRELYRAVTEWPAAVWRLHGAESDLVVAKRPKGAADDYGAWFEINPADIMLVVQGGRVRLADEDRYRSVEKKECFSKIQVQGSTKYVYGDLPGLVAEIRRYAPETVLPI